MFERIIVFAQQRTGLDLQGPCRVQPENGSPCRKNRILDDKVS